MDSPADQLVDQIYEAALHPEQWQGVVEGISSIFGGSPVNMGILVTGVPGLQPRYLAGLPEQGAVQFLEYMVAMPSWNPRVLLPYAERFGDFADDFEQIEPAFTPVYTEWMKPRGLAPIWPAGHMFLSESDESLGGLFVFRREGEEPFSERELAQASRLVPHLRRAVRILAKLGGAQSKRHALAEVLDRLPTGVLLLDSQRRVVLLNQTARSIVEMDDGLRVAPSGPSASDARDNATLQERIADALGSPAGAGAASRSFVNVSRPSGKREFALMVSPFRTPAAVDAADDVSLAIFIVDPEGGEPPVAEVLESLYSLTRSEAEIVRLMASGLSLEEAARSRGISMNTARSHLKHAFSKTRTSRQGELVRLICSGVGAFRER